MLAQNKICLIEKGAERRIGKIMQMRLATNYFHVPRWQIYWGNNPHLVDVDYPVVVKTLKSTLNGDNKILFARQVDPNLLDTQYPWFIQENVNADYDVTVAVVQDKLFAYRLDRNSFDTPDWRKHIYSQNLLWEFFELSTIYSNAVREFMQQANLQFGRLDFLLTGDKLSFLEVNANGQWGWLDIEQNTGLFDAVVEELLR